MTEYSVVGKRIPRVDGAVKATGTARYTTDLKVPGMLWAKVLRCPYPHAKIVKIDTSKAEKLPGVVCVLTHKDAPKNYFNPAGIPFPTGAKEMEPLDVRILEEHCRYVGDRVAAVAAVTKEIAEEAIELIDVQYEQLPAVFDPEAAMKPEAPKIHPETNPKGTNVSMPDEQPWRYEEGDVQRGFKEAELVHEGVYQTARQCHCCMEPSASVAEYDSMSGTLTVVATTQIPFQARKILAQVFSMPVHKIRVKVTYYGGGFGGRQEVMEPMPISALLALKTGKPVKLVYTREEEFKDSRTRHPMKMYLKTGWKKDGTLVALQCRIISNAGAYISHGAMNVGFACEYMAHTYKAPHKLVEGYNVYTNIPTAGAYRGYGNESTHFALETHMDEVSEKLGLDTIELRLKNHVRKGDFWKPSCIELKSDGLQECVDKGAELIGWKDRSKPGEKKGVKRKGIGMATVIHISGCKGNLYSEHTSSFVKMNEDGTVHLITGMVDGGQGTGTVLAQICAEELGVRFEDIKVQSYPEVDTDFHPFDVGLYGSRCTYTAGGSVQRAAADAKRQILELAAQKLEAAVEDLDIKDRRIFVKGSPGTGIGLGDLLMEFNYSRDGAVNVMGKATYEPPGDAPPFCAHFAEVEVDTETGQWKITKFVATGDVGKAINPLQVEGQMQGGTLHGVGYGLSEHLYVDMETGKTLNAEFLNYKMFTAADLPYIQPVIIESNEPTGPFGAKGVGELCNIPAAPAVANAIYNAVGVRISEAPITAEKIYRAIRAKEGAPLKEEPRKYI